MYENTINDLSVDFVKLTEEVMGNDDDNVSYFQRTYGSASNQRTFTVSFWIKRNKLGRNNDLWTPYRGGDGSNESRIQIQSDDQMRIYDSGGSSGYPVVRAAALLRDLSAWYHLVYAIDTTQATDSNRVKLYVNGVHEEHDTSGFHQWPNQNIQLGWNKNHYHRVGAYGQDGTPGSGTANSDYLAEFHVIDGLQLDPSYFGFTEPQTGIWRPKKYTYGNYGTNGFYLVFGDCSSTAALGHDSSGNGNNWTPSSISVSAGENNDSSLDTPSTNFVTLNPLRPQNENCTLSNGNLKATGPSGSFPGVTANIALTSGKWYYEFEINTKTSVPMCGVIKNNYVSGGAGRILYRSGGHYVMHDGAEPTDPDAYDVGDIIGVAIDLDDTAGNIRFYKNGTLQTVNAALNNVKAHLSISTLGGLWPYIQMYTNDVCTANFGQRPFSYTPPSGHKKLTSNTNNNSLDFSTPSILDPKEHFDTLLYTTGSSNGTFTHTGVGFKPDLMWIKCRNAGEHNFFIDSVRGDQAITDKFLRSSDAGAEGTAGVNGTTFTTIDGGFKVVETSIDNSNGGGEIYYASRNYVAWCWKAGGSSNTFNVDGKGYASASAAGITDGSIALTGASVNREAGFSIITYTGGGSAGTIGHGLGKVPKWIITKRRSGSEDWKVYHPNLSGGHFLKLNATQQSTSNTDVYPNTDPTTTVYSVGSHDSVSGNSDTYVAYCWAEIPGYSKFGMYKGNANANGTFVYTGFRPAWIVIKNRDANGFNWVLQDNKRSPFNLCDNKLNPDTNSTEQTDYDKLDITSDGFKLKQNASGSNANAATYVYMAFAEQPGGVTPFEISANAR